MPFPSNAVDKLVAKVEVNFGRDNASKTIYSGGTSSVTVDEQVLEWLNDTQKEVCESQHFWFLHTSTNLTLSAGNDTVALPSDFMDEDSVWKYDSTYETYSEITLMSIEDMRRVYSDSTTPGGAPKHYRLEGDNIIFRPFADDDYTIKLEYWKYLDDLVAGGTGNYLVTKWSHLLEAGATAKAFSSVEQVDMAAVWDAKFRQYLRDLVRENARRVLPDEIVIKPRSDVYGTTITRNKMKG